MQRALFSIIVLLAAFPVASATMPNTWAEDIKPAQAALDVGDYATSYSLYQQEAKRNPLAQFMLGMFHKNGWGHPVDAKIACGWFKQAAQKYIPTAEHYWGDCLAQGIGVKPDIPAAIEWYKQAAADGHLISQCAIADYYIQGKGVAKDVSRGIELCIQVAQANSPPAMLKLARYYETGDYLPQDLASARYWYQQAAERHTTEAQYRLGVMLAQGEGGEPDLNAALLWLETAASKGYTPAYLPTAILYANAPLQPDTGRLAPEHIAKIYLWTSAAKARVSDQEQVTEAKKINELVLSVMPNEWRSSLDKQVMQHLAKYSTE